MGKKHSGLKLFSSAVSF